MANRNDKPLTATVELNRDELLAAARAALHTVSDRTRAIGDQLELYSKQQLADEIAQLLALIERAALVFAHAEGLADG